MLKKKVVRWASSRPAVPGSLKRRRMLSAAPLAFMMGAGVPGLALAQSNQSFGVGYAGLCKVRDAENSEAESATLEKRLRTVFTDVGVYAGFNDFDGVDQTVTQFSVSRRQCATSFIGTWNLEASVAHVDEPLRHANVGLLGAGVTRKIFGWANSAPGMDKQPGAVYLTPMVRMGYGDSRFDSQSIVNASLMLSVIRPVSVLPDGITLDTYWFADVDGSFTQRHFTYARGYGSPFSAGQNGLRLDSGVDVRIDGTDKNWRLRTTAAYQHYSGGGVANSIGSLAFSIRPVRGTNDSSPYYAEITFQRGNNNFKGVLLSVIWTELESLGR